MISIIIPTYNRLRKLQQCLHSIVVQHISGTEIIVVDDASTDNTWHWLQTVDYWHSLILVKCAENKGVNYARNRGIEAATQPFIMFLDSDDALLPGALQQITDAINGNNHYKHYLFLLSCRSQEFTGMCATREVTYADWVSGRLSGDFTHVVASSIVKQHLFFEEFRMFEQLNWFRIYKATSPQIIFPIITSKIETTSNDRLTAAHKLDNATVIKAKFLSEKKFYDLYHPDLQLYNPRYLRLKLLESVVLGVASNLKKESKTLLNYTQKRYIKWMGTAVFCLPPVLIRNFIIQFSRIKNRLRSNT